MITASTTQITGISFLRMQTFSIPSCFFTQLSPIVATMRQGSLPPHSSLKLETPTEVPSLFPCFASSQKLRCCRVHSRVYSRSLDFHEALPLIHSTMFPPASSLNGALMEGIPNLITGLAAVLLGLLTIVTLLIAHCLL